MKWSEKWGIFMYNEGQGLVTLKNIFCDQNFYSPEIARPYYNVTDGDFLAAVPGSSPISTQFPD
jgi:hypothetical protein